MESSPRPSTNSGASVTMSWGRTSSSARAEMISSLISCSSACKFVLFRKVVGQVRVEAARGERGVRRLGDEGRHGDGCVDLDAKVRAACRDLVPLLALGERGGRAADA